MDIISIISLVISIISLVGLIYQSYILNTTIHNQIYQSIINNCLQLDDILIQYPHLRKYICDDAPLSEDNPEFDRIICIIELAIDTMENLDVYKKYLPKDRFDGWIKFMKDIQSSSAYQFYMEKYGTWFEVKSNNKTTIK